MKQRYGYAEVREMKRCFWAACCLGILAGTAAAQGIVGDVLAGKLINPEVGVFAWYDLKDASTGKTLFLRQAIVGTERVKRKTGYWVETEIIPEVGFPAVYKMLLTGPASNSTNVHRIVMKEGQRPPREIPVEEDAVSAETPEERESLGKESLTIPAGSIEAEHVVITSGGARTEVWLNDAVRPMGIVRLTSPEGELMLRRYGKGGPDAESAMARPSDRNETEKNVEVRVDSGVTTNFSGRAKKE